MKLADQRPTRGTSRHNRPVTPSSSDVMITLASVLLQNGIILKKCQE